MAEKIQPSLPLIFGHFTHIPMEQIMLMAAVFPACFAIDFKGLSAVCADLDMDSLSFCLAPMKLPIKATAFLTAKTPMTPGTFGRRQQFSAKQTGLAGFHSVFYAIIFTRFYTSTDIADCFTVKPGNGGDPFVTDAPYAQPSCLLILDFSFIHSILPHSKIAAPGDCLSHIQGTAPSGVSSLLCS
jgi:hypothetical protein